MIKFYDSANPKNGYNLSLGGDGKGKHSEQAILKMSKTYIITYPDGTEKVITNLKNFCRDNNLNDGHLSSIATGNRKLHKGFRCRYFS